MPMAAARPPNLGAGAARGSAPTFGQPHGLHGQSSRRLRHGVRHLGRHRLRRAQANANTSHAGSVIGFDPTLFATPQKITLTRTLELKEQKYPEVIDGPATGDGFSVGGVAIVGNGKTGDFVVDEQATATLSHLLISAGSAVGGGGIANLGTLTISDSIIVGNSSDAAGGGIANNGTLTVSNSLIEGNSTKGEGAGIYNSPIGVGAGTYIGGTLTVSDSLIEGNSAAGEGGGIWNNARLDISDSTVAGNTASDGGGIWNDVVLTAVNDTIAANESSGLLTGGGLSNANDEGGTATLSNTIVALNLNEIFAAQLITLPSDIAGSVTPASALT